MVACTHTHGWEHTKQNLPSQKHILFSVGYHLSKLSMTSDCRKLYHEYTIYLCCIFIVVNVQTPLEYHIDDIWTVVVVAATADIWYLCVHWSVIHQYYRHCVKLFTLFVLDRCTCLFWIIEWYSFRWCGYNYNLCGYVYKWMYVWLYSHNSD